MTTTPHRSQLADPSLWLLLGSNIATGYYAVQAEWSTVDLMAVYLCQSVIIGFFAFIRMMRLKEFSTENLQEPGGGQVPATPEEARKSAWGFALHYGLFHAAYALYVFNIATDPERSSPFVGFDAIAPAVGTFFANHLYSYLRHREHPGELPNLGKIFYQPYFRIIPMHLIIFLGGGVGLFGMGIFIALKTVADALMHVVAHAGSGKRPASRSSGASSS